MCHYCHVLKYNLTAPAHPGIRCLDCANTHSQVPMLQRKYNQGQPISLLPSAPAPDDAPTNGSIPKIKTLFNWFTKRS